MSYGNECTLLQAKAAYKAGVNDASEGKSKRTLNVRPVIQESYDRGYDSLPARLASVDDQFNKMFGGNL